MGLGLGVGGERRRRRRLSCGLERRTSASFECIASGDTGPSTHPQPHLYITYIPPTYLSSSSSQFIILLITTKTVCVLCDLSRLTAAAIMSKGETFSHLHHFTSPKTLSCIMRAVGLFYLFFFYHSYDPWRTNTTFILWISILNY